MEKEFARHSYIANKIGFGVYFANPYSSWERGLNENTNGLIRQFFKKGSDFSNIKSKEINTVMKKLNNRPRKTLSHSTPSKIYFE